MMMGGQEGFQEEFLGYHGNQQGYEDYKEPQQPHYPPPEPRERQRHRDRDRRRDRRRDRDRRDWNRERSRDRFRDDDRSMRSEDEINSFNDSRGSFDGDSSGSQDSWGSGHRQGDSHHEGRGDRGGPRTTWRDEPPSNTILLKALPCHCDEAMLHGETTAMRDLIKDIRLMRKKDTGASRGFAFVEFHNTADAQRWMEVNQGTLKLQGQYKVYMHYSQPRGNPGGGSGNRDSSRQDDVSDPIRTDWVCIKCGTRNFRRRDRCFKCSASREETVMARGVDGYDQVGTNPCNTLLFRGLDALTTEEKLIAALSQVTALTIKNAKTILDETGVSRGYAFVEMNSIRESSQLLETLDRLSSPFEVDGKGIIVTYAKNTFSTVMASLNQWTQGASWEYNQTGEYNQYYNQQQQQQGGYYDQNGQFYSGQNGFNYYYGQQGLEGQAGADGQSTQSDSTNAAAAVAQAAIQQAQAAKHYQKQQQDDVKKPSPEPKPEPDATETQQTASSSSTEWTTTQTDQQQEYTQYPVPDVSKYQYDETSGYYYDSTTGLYYDAGSQYYYNAQTAQFLYWDGEKRTYLPAPTDGDANGAEQKDDGKGKKEKEKKEKVKVAKKIAKDMEKWAKTLNAQKEAMKDFKKSFQPLGGEGGMRKESATADAGFAILEKGGVRTEPQLRQPDQFLMPPPPGPLASGGEAGSAGEAGAASGLVASYGGDSDSDQEDAEENVQNLESKLLDWVKMACLLCKRRFPSKEALQRHQQLSDLHKKNVEDLKKSKGSGNSQSQYRDRAKERRDKYGITDPPIQKKRPQADAPVPFEQPTKEKIGKDNIGNKLMQKMGWSEGQGLGKASQGRTDPIQAQRRSATAGLGARGGNYDVGPSDSYKDTVKKMMMARYNESE